MGASLALQDARVLAQELATGHSQCRSRALARFEQQRSEAAESVKREARFEAAVMFLESEHLRRLRNKVVKHTPLFGLFIKHRATDS